MLPPNGLPDLPLIKAVVLTQGQRKCAEQYQRYFDSENSCSDPFIKMEGEYLQCNAVHLYRHSYVSSVGVAPSGPNREVAAMH